jgi:hypothetical protein
MKSILALFLLLSACTSIDYREGPIPGLEKLTVQENYVDSSEIYQTCSRCGPQGLVVPIACTCINFRTKTAVIWLPQNAPQATIEHERAHARGYDHTTGELRNQYGNWTKASRDKVTWQ